jgi:phenylalanyl-tRNA synthetase beta chain
MKISRNWLAKYLDLSAINDDEVSEILTKLGLEVEGTEHYESIKGGLKGLIVGQVLTCEKHENADKLKVTTVDVGYENPLQIVCGASNVAVGQKVVVAVDGTLIYPINGEPFTIKKSKIRGVESQGMICAEDEIGLGTSHEGILILNENIAVGTKVADLYKVSIDSVFEIGLTPNRSDATCHLGVARDIKAYLQVHKDYKDSVTEPGTQAFHVDNTKSYVPVQVEHVDCIRYCGLTITDIKIAESPEWLKNSLASIGVKSINNIVDITNYILHEYGQPLHAFDYHKIAEKKIIVTKVSQGTEFLALDDRIFKLNEDDLVICDGNRNPMCIAGVYGGKNSGVTEHTTAIFLESAHFSAPCIRKTSMRHNLRTDAAKVFEKGSDPAVTLNALKRAAIMICNIAGGRVSSDVEDIYPHKVESAEVVVRYDRVRKLIGFPFTEESIHNILSALEMGGRKLDHDRVMVTVPTSKVDVIREVDVIEEILRIYGFDNVPVPEKINSAVSYSQLSNKQNIKNKISDSLVANGFFEIMGLSLIESKLCKEILQIPESELVLINNTSNVSLDAMRPDMMLSGLKSVTHNQNRQQNDVKLFEIGKTYRKYNDSFVETSFLSLFVSGLDKVENWQSKSRKLDFYDIKRIVLKILHGLGLNNLTSEILTGDKRFAYGMVLTIHGKKVAELGLIHPKIAKDLDVRNEVFYGEINLDLLFGMTLSNIQMRPISKYPSVTRDLAFVLDKKVEYAQLETIGKKIGKPLMSEMTMFDLYDNEKQVGEGKKSIALRFVFEDSNKTLTEQEIEQKMKKLIDGYTSEVGAILRS